MSSTYKYDHALPRHIVRHILAVIGIAAFLVAVLGGLFFWRSHQHQPVIQGASQAVPQATKSQTYSQIDEPFFTMQLPSDWKQIGSQAVPTEHSISWEASVKNADNRYLTIYIDTIPKTYAVNRELAVSAEGDQLTYGQLSDNCANFTPGGTTDVAQAQSLKPALSLWEGVNFICNLPNFVDNQIGTGSTAGVNTVTIAGPKSGVHSYFFLYIDRNIQPDYTILYGAIQSFRAK